MRRSRATLVGVVVYGIAILLAVSTPWLAVGLIGFAAMGAASDAYQACIRKSGAVIIDANISILDDNAFRRNPAMFELCCPSMDRIAAMQTQSDSRHDGDLLPDGCTILVQNHL